MDNTVLVIYVRSKPLIKERFRFDELSHSHVTRHGATGLLLDRLDKKEEKQKAQSDPGLSEGGFGKEGFNEDVPKEQETHFRKINKKKRGFTIWDYSELEYDELEKEIALKINIDGYYDEIIPVDQNDDSEENSGEKVKIDMKIIGLVITAILSLGTVIWILFGLFR